MQLPEDFIRQTRLLMGEDRFNRFLGAFDEEAPVSIRINPRYSRSEECGVWSEKCSEAESAPESNLTPHSSLLTPHNTLSITLAARSRLYEEISMVPPYDRHPIGM